MMRRLVISRLHVITAVLIASSIASGCLETMGLTPVSTSTGGETGGSGSAQGSGGSGGDIFMEVCKPGEVQSCYPGPQGTEGVGICAPGTQTCLANGTGFGTCDKALVPRFDDCASADDEDCDGQATSSCTGAANSFIPIDVSSTQDLVFGIAARNGHIAVTGVVNGSAVSNRYTQLGTGNMFVGVWDSEGKKIWSHTFTSNTVAVGRAVALLDNGSVIVGGDYMGTFTDAQGAEVLPASDATDAFAMAFDGAGTKQWSTPYRGALDQSIRAIAVSAKNEVYVTGELSGDTTFGCNVLAANTSSRDVYLAKLDEKGACMWSRRWGDNNQQFGRSVAVAPNGDVLMVGSFEGTLDFVDAVLNSAGAMDAFVSRFDANGKLAWAKRFGGNMDQFGWGVAAGPRGEVAMTGFFDGSIDFGGNVLNNRGGLDMYLAVFDANGTHRSSKSFGETFDQHGTAAAIDGAGHVVVGGYAQGDVDFGGGPYMQNNLVDVTYAKFSRDGVHEWSGKKGDINTQVVHAVATDEKGNVYLGGGFEGTLDFGNSVTRTSTGQFDTFVVRLAP
ncbi:MAG TPA: hypothetical protein PK156_08385 [Polyangium sp.]|nr:hypothetical protein [Polyangium sp.]